MGSLHIWIPPLQLTDRHQEHAHLTQCMNDPPQRLAHLPVKGSHPTALGLAPTGPSLYRFPNSRYLLFRESAGLSPLQWWEHCRLESPYRGRSLSRSRLGTDQFRIITHGPEVSASGCNKPSQ